MFLSRSNSAPAANDESVEAVRRRALHRLVGSLVLVSLGVIAFPLVFDTQPRPIQGYARVEIPDPLTAQPIGDPPSQEAKDSSTSELTGQVQEKVSAPGVTRVEAAAPESVPATDPRATVQTQVVEERTESPPRKPAPAPAPAMAQPSKSDQSEAARVLAILQGNAADASNAKSVDKWVVQVGSYSDPGSVERVRKALSSAGFESFTQAVQTQQGELTRVRVGPFASDAAASEAMQKLRDLGLATTKLKL